jgi:2,3-bisphosphoglycerate-dependent phosphoglycerate mutase
MAHKVVLIRHGESIWNKENRFTGWTDVALSAQGVEEAHRAGKLLRENGFTFDLAFCSVLKRAILTLNTILDEMNLDWIPVHKDWRLNERHYGNLQGLNKTEMAQKFGDEQVHIWRRSFDVRPPELGKDDPRHPRFDTRYHGIDESQLPATEALKDCIQRVLPAWNNEIAPRVRSGEKIIIAAHGNSIRALLKHLKNISEKEIMEINIPTATPLVLELDESLQYISDKYLGDAAEIAKAQAAVASQGKTK